MVPWTLKTKKETTCQWANGSQHFKGMCHLHLQSFKVHKEWRWKQHVPSEDLEPPTLQCSVTSQKTRILNRILRLCIQNCLLSGTVMWPYKTLPSLSYASYPVMLMWS